MVRHWLRRGVTLLAAILQLTLAAAVPVLDARVDGQSVRTAVAHVEAERSADCPPVHAADCALCRYLTTFGERAPRAPLAASARKPSAPRVEGTRAPGGAAYAGARPRAPPHAS